MTAIPDQIILLAGGLGTRLREETEFTPKPMIKIGEKPVLWHIMKNLSTQGIKKFIIATGYKGEVIKDYFLNYEARNSDFTISLGSTNKSVTFHNDHEENDWEVTLAYTGELTNTGGRVKLASKYLNLNKNFMVTYGDGLADINLEQLNYFHESHKKLATVTTVQPTSRFGIMEVGNNGEVQDFKEKPQLEGWINIGFFIFNPEVMEYLDIDSTLELNPLQKLAKQNQLAAFRHKGFWQPMDTYREFTMLNDLWRNGKAPWNNWHK